MINKKKKSQRLTIFQEKNRKAEITTEQIVLFIALLAGFVVLLLVLFKINLGGTSETEICHNSVVTRNAGFLTQQIFPINCKTDYICLSKDGSCEKMTSPEIIKVNTKEEVYNVLAEQGANCWWMFGEGKADYIGKEFKSDLYCSICSQVGFDNSLESLFAINPSSISRASAGIPEGYSNSLINKEDFYNYLSTTNVSGKDESYLDYFLGLQNAQLISNALKSNGSNFGYIDLEKQHFIMMGEFSKIGFWQDMVIGAAKAVGAFAVLPVSLVGGPLAIGIVVSTLTHPNPLGQNGKYMIGTVMQGESGHAYLSPTIIEANSEDYKNLKCENVNTLA